VGNLLAGAAMLAVVAAGWLALRRDPALATFDFGSDPGPLLVPRLLLAALGIGGAALVVQGGWQVSRRPGGLPAPCPAVEPQRVLWPASFVASLVAYQQILPAAGYLAATFTFCAAWILVLGWRWGTLTARSALAGVVGAGAITASIYGVFKLFVRVPLP
jgi:hypothetical protein